MVARKTPLVPLLLEGADRKSPVMPKVLIHTDRKDFITSLVRGEMLPYGVSFPKNGEHSKSHPNGEITVTLEVNLRLISGTAFALWVLRKLRSIQGGHQLEIRGEIMCLLMPQAIDLIADQVTGTNRSDTPVAA